MFGLVFAVPLSAGKNWIFDNGYHNCILAYDIHNGALISGMKLAGLVNICCGFFLVRTPANWVEILRSFIM